MKKENKNQTPLFQFFKIFILIAILIFLYVIINQTYSKYITKFDNNGINSSIANWNIKINGEKLSSYSESKLLDLDITWEDNPNIDKNTVAPTSSGSTEVLITSTGTQVPYKYTITIPTDDAYIEDFRIVAYKINDGERIEIPTSTTTSSSEGTSSTSSTSEPPKIEGIINPDSDPTKEVENKFTLYFKWYDGEGEILNNYNDTRKTLNPDRKQANIKIKVDITQYLDESSTSTTTSTT